MVYLAKAQEISQLRFGCWWFRISQRLDICDFYFLFPDFDDMAEVFNEVAEIFPLFDLQGHTGITEGSENRIYLFNMAFNSPPVWMRVRILDCNHVELPVINKKA